MLEKIYGSDKCYRRNDSLNRDIDLCGTVQNVCGSKNFSLYPVLLDPMRTFSRTNTSTLKKGY